jgi:hypothetical protein
MTVEEFIQLHYSNRQLIMFSMDIIEPTTSSLLVTLQEMYGKVKKHPIKYFFRQALYNDITFQAMRQMWNELFKDDRPLTFFPTEYAESFKLPPGQVHVGELYTAHPITSQNLFYYPLHEFHLSMHRQKSHELIQILRSMQVKYYRIEHIEGFKDGKGFSVDGSAIIDDMKIGVGGGQRKETSFENNVICEETPTPTGEIPQLPQSLIWYDFEPEWQVAVDGILKHGTQQMSFVYSYVNNYGVDINFNLAYDKAKLNTKIQGTEFQKTVWKVTFER